MRSQSDYFQLYQEAKKHGHFSWAQSGMATDPALGHRRRGGWHRNGLQPPKQCARCKQGISGRGGRAAAMDRCLLYAWRQQDGESGGWLQESHGWMAGSYTEGFASRKAWVEARPASLFEDQLAIGRTEGQRVQGVGLIYSCVFRIFKSVGVEIIRATL